MKKSIKIAMSAVILSAGVIFAGAASVNGTFENLPIVKVIMNGQTLKSDVPGVNI